MTVENIGITAGSPLGGRLPEAAAVTPRPEGRALAAGESWPADTALFLLTYSRNERFIPAARANIDRFWPNHPDLFVVTDGALTGDDVIRGPGLTFAALLRHALDDLAARRPGTRFVWLLLEDLAPLGAVDEVYLRAIEDAMRARDARFVVTLCQGSGKQTALPQATERFGEGAARLGLHEIPADATAYNCLVTCWWDIAHLRAVIDHKIATGQDGPWAFEHPDAALTEPHYMAQDCWPTFRSGFLKLGRFSKHLTRPHHFPRSPLLDMVEREFLSEGDWRQRLSRRMKHAEARLKTALTGGRRAS